MMRYSISDTAEFGDYETGKRLITDETKKEMKKVLKEIQDGTFASKWIAENNNGRAHFNAMRQLEAEHQLEEVGAEIRKMYSWNDSESIYEAEKGKTKLWLIQNKFYIGRTVKVRPSFMVLYINIYI